ncbi:MAG: SpoIIE family protein phosphatase [Candidatus Velthaea sp.]
MITLLIWPRRALLLGPSAAFFGAYGAILVSTEAMIAFVLAIRARALGDARIAVLAGAYVFSTPLVLGNVLTLPTIAGVSFDFQTPPWMWLFWHIGWSMAVTFYAWANPSRTAVLGWTAGGFLASAGCMALAFNAASLLPPLLLAGGGWTPTLTAGYVVALVLNASALAGLLRRTSRASTLDMWVALAVVAALGEIALISTSVVRFSLGTYAGRMFSAVSGVAVFISIAANYIAATRRTALLEQHASLADASPELVFMTDAFGACTYVNRRWTEVTGQPAEAALGDGWRGVLHAKDAERHRLEWDRHKDGGRPHQHELRYRTADGGFRLHRTRMTPVRDDEESIVAWLGSALDIEDHRRALDDIRQLYERERRVAETLQAAFLPPFLPNLAGLRFEAVYMAAATRAEIGGDWYDAFPTHDGRIAFSVGDVMGHGFEAASSMIRVRETIRAAAASLEAQPAAVLAFANRALCAAVGESLATAVFAVYDPATRGLSYSSAGHPRPILRRSGTGGYLEGGGLALGIDPSAEYPTHEVRLESHDAVALYTDGLIESTHDLAEGEERLVAAFSRRTAVAQEVVDEVLADGQRDDVALLVMEVSGTPPRSMRRH